MAEAYLRLRPLIKEEEGHELIEYSISEDKETFKIKLPASSSSSSTQRLKTINPAFASAPPLRGRNTANKWKSYSGFTSILSTDESNESVYQTTVQPNLKKLIADNDKRSCCTFTYGHTGSGKTHTLLGYEEEGIYKYAIRDMFNNESLIAPPNDDEERLLVRVIELYKDQVYDLLNPGDECTIRNDSQQQVQVRGPMVEDDMGRITQPILGQVCSSVEEVIDVVDKACETRRVGTSTHHSQSSRSHLIMEFEITTDELYNENTKLLVERDSHLTRLKWLQFERMFKRHTGEWPAWTEDFTSGKKLREDIVKYERLVEESKKTIQSILTRNPKLGKTVIFCDLAGNEYAKDAASSTKEEMEEAAVINKSLLGVKELIRNGSGGRDSKLCMILRHHLATRSTTTTATTTNTTTTSTTVMLGHVSPSKEYYNKTINTLNYCSMLGDKQKTKKTGGKENKTKNVAVVTTVS